ncbi:MAG: DeoR/GlpR transcriptional regulator [Clostridia bacterium]|nr:DeoR/GlpR transcriptional regulator [Clostridia bacterium]
MYCTERYEEIIRILQERKSVSVRYLAEKLYVSEPTVRRDLAVLENEGKLKRTFGGAVISSLIKNEVPLVIRKNAEIPEKESIAAQAVPYIRDGMVLFLDASSTAYYLLDRLAAFSDLTVITNSPSAPLKLAELKINCISTGGNLLPNSVSFVGRHAEELAARFNADAFFFSCRGLSEDGLLTDTSVEESELRRVMMAHSAQNILLCTSSKIGKRYMYTLCDLSAVDTVLCDKELPASLRVKQ